MNFVLYYMFRCLEFALLSPIALIGLMLEFLRSMCVKVKRKIKRTPSSPSLNPIILGESDESGAE